MSQVSGSFNTGGVDSGMSSPRSSFSAMSKPGAPATVSSTAVPTTLALPMGSNAPVSPPTPSLLSGSSSSKEEKKKLVIKDSAYQRYSFFNQTLRNYGFLSGKAVVPVLDMTYAKES